MKSSMSLTRYTKRLRRLRNCIICTTQKREIVSSAGTDGGSMICTDRNRILRKEFGNADIVKTWKIPSIGLEKKTDRDCDECV